MIENNPVYFTPIKDDHAIEIMLSCLFLAQQGRHDFIHKWVEQITYATIMAYRRGGYYPCTLQEYSDLAEHPQPSDEYRKEVTAGSILYPTLAVWLAIVRHEQTLSDIADFSVKDMEHCTFQLWLPDGATEEHLYRNSHSKFQTPIPVVKNGSTARSSRISEVFPETCTSRQVTA